MNTYIKRFLQSALSVWTILAVIIIASYIFYISLRAAEVNENTSLLVTFIASSILILLALLQFSPSFLNLKEKNKTVLESISRRWTSGRNIGQRQAEPIAQSVQFLINTQNLTEQKQTEVISQLIQSVEQLIQSMERQQANFDKLVSSQVSQQGSFGDLVQHLDRSQETLNQTNKELRQGIEQFMNYQATIEREQADPIKQLTQSIEKLIQHLEKQKPNAQALHLAIIGPQGSGKSTYVEAAVRSILGGIERPVYIWDPQQGEPRIWTKSSGEEPIIWMAYDEYGQIRGSEGKPIIWFGTEEESEQTEAE